jgi:hypothetical protein
VLTWKYEVRASLAGRPPVDIGEHEAPVPDERRLTGATAVLAEPVASEPNTERRVVLREQPVGYVVGTLRPPAGLAAADFNIYLAGADSRHGARVHYRPSTGEFVAGPFAAGEVRLRVWRWDKSGGSVGGEVGIRDVRVEAGKVVRVELTPAAEPPRPLAGRGGMVIGTGGMSVQATGAAGLAGRVLLPGGREPALGAVVTYFEPGRWQPVLGGLTDARGQIRGKGLWYFNNSGSGEPPDDPPGPVVVALLPGSHGAALVPPPEPGKPLEVVLPPALAVRGRVTVGGATPSKLAGSIRILAAYEGTGQGRLGGVLSVQTTAQEDGSFELAGLTPGRYAVQAALDDIWLSPPVAVAVTDRPPGDIALAIPAPGGPAVVTVVGPDGTPRPGRPISIDRPDGPLAALLWPGGWTTDGAGRVHVPALEAGRHTLRVTGTGASAEVVIPAPPAGRPAEVQIRLGPDGGR